MERFNEQEMAAYQAISEIAADLGPGFLLRAVADSLGQMSRTEADERGENLSQAEGILRQLAEVLDEAG